MCLSFLAMPMELLEKPKRPIFFLKKKRKKRGRNIKGTCWACFLSSPILARLHTFLDFFWELTCFLICFRCCSMQWFPGPEILVPFSPQYLRLFWCLPVLAQVPKAATFFFKKKEDFVLFYPYFFRHGFSFSRPIPTAPLTRLLFLRCVSWRLRVCRWVTGDCSGRVQVQVSASSPFPLYGGDWELEATLQCRRCLVSLGAGWSWGGQISVPIAHRFLQFFVVWLVSVFCFPPPSE